VAPPKTIIASALGIGARGIFCHSSDRTKYLAAQLLLQISNKLKEKEIAIADIRGRFHNVSKATTKPILANPKG
jgi:hypothetical protein